ncbi:perilipin-2-like [Anomaloglossus baeobatrachus]|uniref:perilipin-2-like n=1 Tax=Anomaloglossus baeobatrachus TaxID=238106 RepID=UPI003F50916B
MAEGEENQNMGVVLLVARLPFVRSAAQILCFVYRDVKSRHPLVERACEVSEKGVLAVSGAAALRASPILKLVEPELALINGAALRVMDELEVRLPVLHRPADEVAADIHLRLVMGVSAVRTRALGRAQDVINRTQTIVTEVYEATSLGVLSLGAIGAREMVRLGAELAVTRAEELVDLYLPKEDEEGDQRGLRGRGIEELDEEPECGAVSRLWMLAAVVLTRGVSRLGSSLDQVFSFLHGGLHLVSGILTQVKRFSDAITGTMMAQNICEETPKPKAMEPSPGQAPKRRRSIHCPGGVSVCGDSDNHRSSGVNGARDRVPERRCRSLDSASYP